jgi:GxxExxY protein
MQAHNELGHGFLEKVYENALMSLPRREGMKTMQQAAVDVKFQTEVVGEYYADILVDDQIILELKCVDEVTSVHRAQAMNYLKATGLELAVILYLKKTKMEFERIILQDRTIRTHSRPFTAD